LVPHKFYYCRRHRLGNIKQSKIKEDNHGRVY
jgi:hypothetical protein